MTFIDIFIITLLFGGVILLLLALVGVGDRICTLLQHILQTLQEKD